MRKCEKTVGKTAGKVQEKCGKTAEKVRCGRDRERQGAGSVNAVHCQVYCQS